MRAKLNKQHEIDMAKVNNLGVPNSNFIPLAPVGGHVGCAMIRFECAIGSRWVRKVFLIPTCYQLHWRSRPMHWGSRPM